jgi:hypothetical protein
VLHGGPTWFGLSLLVRTHNATLSNVTKLFLDFYDAANLASKALATFDFIPKSYISALEGYVSTLAPTSSSPYTTFHSTMLLIHSTVIAMLLSLSRPTTLIQSINTSRKSIERSYNSLSRSTRWPLGLLDETRQRLNEEKEEKVRKTQEECEEVGRELRYTQQVVASELAGWQDLHEKMGKKALRELAKGMIIKERTALEGMKRAFRKLKLESAKVVVAQTSGGRVDVEVNACAVLSGPSCEME